MVREWQKTDKISELNNYLSTHLASSRPAEPSVSARGVHTWVSSDLAPGIYIRIFSSLVAGNIFRIFWWLRIALYISRTRSILVAQKCFQNIFNFDGSEYVLFFKNIFSLGGWYSPVRYIDMTYRLSIYRHF